MSLGTPLLLKGKSWGGQGSALPLPLIDSLVRLPIPVTIGGSNNVTFTVAASTSRRVPIFIGDEFADLTWPVAYTWGAVSNAILHATTGAETTDADSVLGVWYMYFRYVIATGAISLIASQGAPGYVQGPGHAAVLSHLGTARDPAFFYQYCGFMVCTTAATPAFLTMVKIGYEWHWAALTAAPVTAAVTATSVFTVRLPKLAKFGGRVAGNITTGKAGKVTVSASSVANQGVAVVNCSGSASVVGIAPFDIAGPNDTNGELYAIAVVSTGATIGVTQYRDVV